MESKKSLDILRTMLLVALAQVDKVDQSIVPKRANRRPKKVPHVKLELIRGGKG